MTVFLFCHAAKHFIHRESQDIGKSIFLVLLIRKPGIAQINSVKLSKFAELPSNRLKYYRNLDMQNLTAI